MEEDRWEDDLYEEDRCSLFSFTTGNVVAAALHFLCAVSGWCSLVFPLLSVLLFFLEKNRNSRAACLHTAVTALAAAVLGFMPTVFWLIVFGATRGEGAFFVIVTVLFIAVMLILWFVLLAVEITCGVKALKHEPVEVPFITKWVAKLAKKA